MKHLPAWPFLVAAILLLSALLAKCFASDYDIALAKWLKVEPHTPQVVWYADQKALLDLHVYGYGKNNGWMCDNGVIRAFHIFNETPSMQHETFHSVAHARLGGLPRWLNEGTATMMEYATPENGDLKFRVSYIRLREAWRNERPIQDILNFTADDYTGDKSKTAYNLSYALCEFIRRDGNILRWLNHDGYTLDQEAFHKFLSTPSAW